MDRDFWIDEICATSLHLEFDPKSLDRGRREGAARMAEDEECSKVVAVVRETSRASRVSRLEYSYSTPEESDTRVHN
jgi:hypothetical protein